MAVYKPGEWANSLLLRFEEQVSGFTTGNALFLATQFGAYSDVKIFIHKSSSAHTIFSLMVSEPVTHVDLF